MNSSSVLGLVIGRLTNKRNLEGKKGGGAKMTQGFQIAHSSLYLKL